MRTVKDAEERRNEILDAAEKLFSRKSFEAATTADILNEVGIARGTLYYHFKSKEDIMDGLIDRYSSRMLAAATEAAGDGSLPVMGRIMAVIMSLKLDAENGKEVIEYIHSPGNLIMHHKIQQMIIKNVTPILADIIRDGIDEGLFNTPFPYECMEMMIVYTSTIMDSDTVQLTQEETESRTRAVIFNLERLLGAEEGSLLECVQLLGRPEA